MKKKKTINKDPGLFFLFCLLALWLKTVVVSFIGFDLPVQNILDVLLILFNPIGSLILLLGCSFFFGFRLNRTILVIIMTVVTGMLYADLLYYRFYIDFVTVSILFQFKNVGGIGPSTFELMKGWDLLLFVDIIAAGMLARKWDSGRLAIPAKRKKQWIVAGAAMLLFTAGLGLISSSHVFSASYNRGQMVKAIGPYNYHLYDIALGFRSPIDRAFADKSDTASIKEYLSDKENDTSDLFGIAKGKNLVLISMESTQDFVIGQKVNGKEITPFLNKLINESYYFNQIYDQTAQGKTSDSEFMIDTGLYPLSGGSVFVRRPENTFNSLPKILKKNRNYYAASFHGNDPSFWNRKQMYATLGYDRFFAKADYRVTDDNSVNYGIKDIPFFEQSINRLEGLPEPYYAKLITLTNHFPFLLNEEDQMISTANTDQEVVNRYVTTVRYQDEAIKTFFSRLKAKGMYQDTVFVLYGDHYGISEKYEAALSEMLGDQPNQVNHTKYRQIPVVIHVPGHSGKTIENLGGEIDIRETLLHLLGIETRGFMSFGHDLFTRKSEHPVIFRDGSFVGDRVIYQDESCYDKNTGKEIAPEACEPYQETVRNELDLSDEIIYGDLLRFMRNH
ncbi:LTA synthase family protein [Peribacillus cavernae]|uniref:LTA synthase family protein n=1 Tax=Peribacillus cavernae TaxID=1674310 RepID=A0A433HPF5_9BACI|nr:LTA synthase family protein [Peribacillus cavernae]MDQ0217320.1 lipoteichoic acid synthase [Peribacillus cavernae]RUQ30220.1 LTA synthase family protein [Peribacillus cavernae]